MKSFHLASLFAAATVLAQSAVPAQVSEIQAFLPTSAIAANKGFATENSPAWATLQAKLHSLIAQDEAFFQTYSGAVPGFGGFSALIATAYDTALVTGGASTTSSSSSSSSASITPTTTGGLAVASSSSSSSTTLTTETSSSSSSVTPTSSLTASNAAPSQHASFGVIGAAFAGVAGLAVLL